MHTFDCPGTYRVVPAGHEATGGPPPLLALRIPLRKFGEGTLSWKVSLRPWRIPS